MQPIEFGAFEAELVEFEVEWTKQQLDQKHVWGPVTGLDMDVHGVRVALPQDGIDCMLLDGLIEHEAIDPFVKQAVASGGTFRLARISHQGVSPG